MNIKKILETAINATVYAGLEIIKIYESDNFGVTSKADNSPLTLADMSANNKILEYLKKTDIPILSEEGKDIEYKERKNWKSFWLVDPLDGTKEFINKNGEFTVNIALIKNNIPVAGVIYIPVLKQLYYGTDSIGAFKIENIEATTSNFYDEKDSWKWNNPVLLINNKRASSYDDFENNSVKLPLSINSEDKKYTVVGSRSHKSPENEKYLKNLKNKHGKIEIISKGSSLKFCMIAEGKADIYPRLAPTMEWDTAAGHAIVKASGGNVMKTNGEDLNYNKENLLNPFFVAKS